MGRTPEGLLQYVQRNHRVSERFEKRSTVEDHQATGFPSRENHGGLIQFWSFHQRTG